MRSTVCAILSLVGAITLIQSFASADPLPGEVLKFRQLPLNNGAIPGFLDIAGAPFPGHDELSTATLTSTTAGGPPVYQGTYMADDFADHFLSPIVHIRWWGSYAQNFTGNTANPGVKQFLISFEKDIPAQSTTDFSRPGEVLSSQIVTLAGPNDPLHPGSGTFTEGALTTPPPPPGAAPSRKALSIQCRAESGQGISGAPRNGLLAKNCRPGGSAKGRPDPMGLA